MTIELGEIVPRQLTNTAVMISPDHFGFNPQTAETNVFQEDLQQQGIATQEIRNRAIEEFYRMVGTLTDHDLQILVVPSRTDVVTPDAVFPNNWVSHHQTKNPGGKLVLYPMLTPNRRKERQLAALQGQLTTIGIKQPEVLDLTSWEEQGKILEGTGSLVLDRSNKVAFAMESPRTTEEAFHQWCQQMGYDPVFFHAYDKGSLPIYHTNVVMSIGQDIAVACPESIQDNDERKMFASRLEGLNKEIISITLPQLYNFCGNILQMNSTKGVPKIVLSKTAFGSFSPEQRRTLEKYGDLVPVTIPTIETVGGGSARCMLAEVFPPHSGYERVGTTTE